MRLVKSVLVSAFALCGVLPAQAQSLQTIRAANNQIQFGLGVHDLEYAEYDNYKKTPDGGYFSAERGSQPALSITTTQQATLFGQENIYWKIDYLGAKGTTAYTGYLQYPNGTLVPYKNTTDSGMDSFSLHVGKALPVSPQAQVTPFAGFSSRDWLRSMQGPYGYRELYSYKALEVGVLGQYAFTPKLVGSASLSMGNMYNATMTANIAGTGTFDLGERPISTIKLGLDYALTSRTHVFGNYSRTSFKFGESPVTGGFFEPESFTNADTFTMGVGFLF